LANQNKKNVLVSVEASSFVINLKMLAHDIFSVKIHDHSFVLRMMVCLQLLDEKGKKK
jgi:ABC-type protease/lipase transport system fused ATPase/permease subunit